MDQHIHLVAAAIVGGETCAATIEVKQRSEKVLRNWVTFFTFSAILATHITTTAYKVDC